MPLPQLGTVSPVLDEITIKATSSGIVSLKQNRFRTRYTGNKHSAVDLNGNLWPRAAELRKLISGERKEKAKKKAKVKTSADEIAISEQQISDLNPEKPAPDADLFKKPRRTYTVHKQQVRQRILGYINTQRGKKELYFWTVTFPMGTPDDIGYQIFNIWLTKLRQYKMLKEYLWIAERQDGKRNDYQSATNTIHYHIAIPHKLPVQRANAMMAGTLKTFARRGLIPFSVHACKRYNGVDICKHRTTRRVVNFANKKGSRALGQYLTKYITKNDGEFTRLAWHNSRGFSSIFTGVTFTKQEFTNNGWHLLIDRRKAISTEFFTFVPWINDPPWELMDHLYQLNSYLQDILN